MAYEIRIRSGEISVWQGEVYIGRFINLTCAIEWVDAANQRDETTGQDRVLVQMEEEVTQEAPQTVYVIERKLRGRWQPLDRVGWPLWRYDTLEMAEMAKRRLELAWPKVEHRIRALKFFGVGIDDLDAASDL